MNINISSEKIILWKKIIQFFLSPCDFHMKKKIHNVFTPGNFDKEKKVWKLFFWLLHVNRKKNVWRKANQMYQTITANGVWFTRRLNKYDWMAIRWCINNYQLMSINISSKNSYCDFHKEKENFIFFSPCDFHKEKKNSCGFTRRKNYLNFSNRRFLLAVKTTVKQTTV